MAKSSAGAITDFFIALGFDATEVKKGFGEIDKLFQASQKKQSNIVEKEAKKQTRAKKSAADKVNDAIRKADEKFRKDYLKAEAEAHKINDKMLKDAAKAEEKRLSGIEKAKKDAAKAEEKRLSGIEKARKEAEKAKEKARKDAEKSAKAEAKRNSKIHQQSIKDARSVHNRQEKLRSKYYDNQSRQEDVIFRARRVNNKMLGSLQDKKGRFNPRLLASAEGGAELANFRNRFNTISQSATTARTAADYRKLNQEIRLLNDSYGRLVLMNKRVQKEFQASAFSAKAMSDSMRNMARSYLSVFAVVGGGAMAANSGMNLASAQVGLITGTGSYEAAGKELEFLKEVSRVYGTATTDTIKAYGKISAGAKTAGLSVEQIRELFIGLNEAAVGFSLTADEMTGVFKAITDSFSKGTLMAEELKGQLGDRMPVAVGAMAKALNVTTAELFKMMENGELISSEVLPKLSKGLQAMAHDSGGFAAGMKASGREMSRFGTMFEQSIGKSFESGLERGLAEFFKYMTAITKQSGPVFKTIGRIVGALLEFIGVTALAIKQIFRPFTILLDSFSSKTDDASKSVGWLTRALAGLVAIILTPFALMEQWNDKLEKLDGGFIKFALTLGTVIAKSYVLFKVFGTIFKMFKFGGTLSKWLSGWGIVKGVFDFITGGNITSAIGRLQTAFEKFGNVAKGVFNALLRHPLIASLTMLAGVLMNMSSEENRDVFSDMRKTKAMAGKTGWWEDVKTGLDYALWGFADTGGSLLGLDVPNMADLYRQEYKPSSKVTTINVTAHNPQELVNAVKPYLLDTVDQRIDYTIMTSMSNQD